MSFVPPNSVPYRSAAQTDARPANPPSRKYVLPDECPIQLAAYAFDQEFEQKLSSFPPAPRNTISTDSSFGNLGDSSAILTKYSQPSPTGAGLGKYTAQFNIVPATWNDYKMMSFTFPGFPGYIGSKDARNPFTDNVMVRMQHDFYVVDSGNILGGNPTSGGGVSNAALLLDSGSSAVKTVFSLADIPVIDKTNFVTVVDSAAVPSMRQNSLAPTGGITTGTTLWLETLPNRAYYQKWVSNAVANRWTSSVWDGSTGIGYTAGTASTVGQFVIEESQLSPYSGNIIQRITTYILAK